MRSNTSSRSSWPAWWPIGCLPPSWTVRSVSPSCSSLPSCLPMRGFLSRVDPSPLGLPERPTGNGRPRQTRRPLGRTAICLLMGGIGLSVAGCGGVTRTVTSVFTVAAPVKTVTVTTSASTSARSTSAGTAEAPRATAPVALAVKDLHGNTLEVAIPKVIDPASSGPPIATPPTAGHRFLAILFKLTDRGPGSVSSDINADATAIGSDSQAYMAAIVTVARCTSFSNGEYTVFPGQSERGCAVFELPNRVKLADVQFAIDGNTIEFRA